MKKLQFLSVLSMAALAILFLSRCGTAPDSTITAGTFTSVYSILKSNNCMECHAPGQSATVTSLVQLDFTSQSTAYSTLTTKSVTGSVSSGTCGTAKIVTAGDLTKSYLAAVLISSYNSGNAGVLGCVPYTVHLTDTHPSSSDLSSIKQWITNGAKND